ncbi:MAG: hypothetical protein ACREBW_07045, partial [Candidatus Micrarchaeaceae archaeon]
INSGTMTGSGQVEGIGNFGTINNSGTVTGSGGVGFFGIVNGATPPGTINNDGTVTGSGIYGIVNFETINDYCGATLTGTVTEDGTIYTVPCYTVTFDQTGVPTSGVTWGVTVSWPFGTTDHTGTGASISVSSLGGSITYSYDSPVAGSGVTSYVCQSGCSSAASLSSPTLFSAAYSPTTSSTVPQFPIAPLSSLLLIALLLPALLVIERKFRASKIPL